jgi:hypothetical protein
LYLPAAWSNVTACLLFETYWRRGTRVASAPDDGDEEEVLPGLTRRQLKEQAGF